MALSFSHAILEWARNKPADEAYDYYDHGYCAVAQFLIDTGRATNRDCAGGSYWMDDGGVAHTLPRAVDAAAQGRDREDAWTFGQFADRLEQALAR